MIAQHEPGRADWAVQSLDRVGLRAYRPMYRERRFFRHKKDWVSKPLLDRYFFVGFSEDWRSAYRDDLPGMASILTDKLISMPRLVRGIYIDNLKSIEVHGHVPVRIDDRFRVSQRCLLDGESQLPLEGKYQGKDQNGFEIFLVQICRRDVMVKRSYGSAVALDVAAA